VKQSRAVDKGLAGMSIPACPVHVTSTVNKFGQGVLKSRRQVPEHAHAISSLSAALFKFSKFGIYPYCREYLKPRVQSAML